MIHLSSSNRFGLLFSSWNWTNSENIPKNSSFSLDFDDFCWCFECHSILAEKQRTYQTNYSSLTLSPSLDTQDILQDGIIVELKKFRQEIPVWIPKPDTTSVCSCVQQNSEAVEETTRGCCWAILFWWWWISWWGTTTIYTYQDSISSLLLLFSCTFVFFLAGLG